MAAGWPAKVNYATGDVLSASNMNDIGGTLNLINPYTAGKNAIINGAFNVNQRAFSSTTTTNSYTFDRFLFEYTGGTVTLSSQTFTAGTAPVAGYEGKNFCRIVTSGQSAAGDYAGYFQKIESVRTFAGQTVTFSLWAKASSGTPLIGVSYEQNFGTGGSPSTAVIGTTTTQAVTTSYVRYSFTLTIPSIAGKTLGTNGNDFLSIRLFSSVGTTISALGYPAVGIQNVTIDSWGWQVEAGSTATAFQTASGTIGGELALCQRYYYRATTTDGYASMSNTGIGASTTVAKIDLAMPVTMRVAPTAIDYSTVAAWDTVTITAATSVTLDRVTNSYALLNVTCASGLTQFRPYMVIANNSTSAYIGVSAEL